ncbi:MAG: beta-propeller fold lactonase family protein [Gaiellaceae bacterium]
MLLRFSQAPFALAAPVQREVGLLQGGEIILAGGLDAAGRSTNGVFSLAPGDGQLTRLGDVPQAFHDAAAAIVGRRLLVFGGGPETGTSTVQSFDFVSHTARIVGRLPQALSDLAAATLNRTVYLVGGFDGSTPQRTIYATNDGVRFRSAGQLPVGLRYPAVTSTGGALVIAGGVGPAGTVSSVYRFDPRNRRVMLLAHLPSPLAHAAAFTIGQTVYVAGGRDATGSALATLFAIDPASHRARELPRLPVALADAAAISDGRNAWLVGGKSDHTLSTVLRAGPTSGNANQPLGATRSNVYAATASMNFSSAVVGIQQRVYVPNSRSGTVDVIDPTTFKIIRHFRVGVYAQHITPAWDLRHLYVNNTASNSLTVIDPRRGRPVGTIPVRDPYNLYFTPDGSTAIVVVESFERLDLRDPHTWALRASIPIRAAGPNHLDFSADGKFLLISAEFSGDVVRVDMSSQKVTGRMFVGGSPVDVKLAPDGSVFYVANQLLGGVSVIDPGRMRQIAFIRTGRGAHGLAISRDTSRLYVSNRLGGSLSVIDLAKRRLIATWKVGGSPDMLQVSPDGGRLWVSNRYSRSVSVVDTRNGRLIHTIRVGNSPHGLAYFPQPGRFSLGHNGVYR